MAVGLDRHTPLAWFMLASDGVLTTALGDRYASITVRNVVKGQSSQMSNVQSNPLMVLADPNLSGMFGRPSRRGVESAWYGHVPFGMWIVGQIQPQLLVELGTHTGVSYSAFCDAVVHNRLSTRCFAVDTWKGDAHAGFYGEDIFADFAHFHDSRYRSFSSLLRMSFDEALEQFHDGSVDLLHIDGLHTYEAASHDFAQWLPKLSERAVVLLHDTNVHVSDYGVWRLWRELCKSYSNFEFFHSSGLGVLAIGSHIPPSIERLCQLELDDTIALVRDRFALLGECWENAARLDIERLRSGEAETNLCLMRRQNEELWKENRNLQDLIKATRKTLELTRDRLSATQATADERQREAQRLIAERQAILNSTFWRAIAPMRQVADLVPIPVRRLVRSAITKTCSAPAILRARRVGRKHADRQLPERSRRGIAYFKPVLSVALISGEPSTPGHTYRIAHYAKAFASAGASVREWTYSEAVLHASQIAEEAQLIFIWRARVGPEIDAVIEGARQNGAKIAFDIDDLMFDPSLAADDTIDGIRSQGLAPTQVAEHFQAVREILLHADICTCTTEELAFRIRELDKPTIVLPNGFDEETILTSRLAVRLRKSRKHEKVVRIGYAAGTRTHQRDFGRVSDALARVLAARPECRLVLFQDPETGERMLDVAEFPDLAAHEDQIEWRDLVPLSDLPKELARFDINLAPIETGNPFCEAKSELKFFEAALVDVCTIASPTGPMRRAIRDHETGLLADTPEQWHSAIVTLLDNAELRQRVGHRAYLEVLYRHGTHRRVDLVSALLQHTLGGSQAASAFELEFHRRNIGEYNHHDLPEADTVFVADSLGVADVTVIIPLYNYEMYIEDSLASVRDQTLEAVDLVVVDDASTDRSLEVAQAWIEREAPRFNRVLIMRNRVNSGLARTRNVGFDAAETPFVVPLDADNRLLPGFCSRTLTSLQGTCAAFAYTKIQCFGTMDHVIGTEPFSPIRFASGNYIDAMALVAKWAWAAVGGYVHIDRGWEDYDFWCRCIEHGFWGTHIPEILAEYRVHDASMLRTLTDLRHNKQQLIQELSHRHSWLSLTDRD